MKPPFEPEVLSILQKRLIAREPLEHVIEKSEMRAKLEAGEGLGREHHFDLEDGARLTISLERHTPKLVYLHVSVSFEKNTLAWAAMRQVMGAITADVPDEARRAYLAGWATSIMFAYLKQIDPTRVLLQHSRLECVMIGEGNAIPHAFYRWEE